MSDQQFHRNTNDAPHTENGQADAEKFQRKQETFLDRLASIWGSIVYPKGHVSVHRAAHWGEAKKAKARNRARAKAARASRKHARPRYTRRGK